MSDYIHTVLEIDDQDMVDEFINDYMRLLQDSLPQMQVAFEKKDFQELRSLAHAIKGCSANIGAEPARSTALELQESAELQDVAKCGSLLVQLKAFLSGVIR